MSPDEARADVIAGSVERARVRLAWEQDPFHPSLHFKKVRGDVWSVRGDLHYRALGTFPDERIIWVWIGTHGEYDALLR